MTDAPMIGRRPLLSAAGLVLGAAAPPVSLAATPVSRLDTPWWRQRHAEKLAEIRARRVDLVFLGDSITQNWERGGPQPWQDFRPAWRHYYADRNAVNLGFKGDATCHLLWRLRNGEVAGIAPRAAVILIGANNLGRLHWPAADDVAGIIAVAEETRHRLPQTRVLLLGVLPSERSAWASETTLEINRALAARYAGSDVTFIDLAPLFAPGGHLDRSLFYDPLLSPPEPPLHPTAPAQARMAAAIEPALAGMLGDRARPAFGA
jgi:lysophospholipase L1-like esterase